MCTRCDKEVAEMGILESDLPNLPYKPMYWYCMVPGCHCKTTVRDYGIAPIYWWPVKVRRYKDGSWRGGWTNCMHGYICTNHFKEYSKSPREFTKKYCRDAKEMLARVIEKKQRKKR